MTTDILNGENAWNVARRCVAKTSNAMWKINTIEESNRLRGTQSGAFPLGHTA